MRREPTNPLFATHHCGKQGLDGNAPTGNVKDSYLNHPGDYLLNHPGDYSNHP